MKPLYPDPAYAASAEHREFRDTVRRFIAEEITPHHAQWEHDGQVPRALWRRAGELGLLCLTMPEEFGGAGADFSYSAIVTAEMARAGATGPLFYLHSDIVAPYLLHHGTGEQKREWLPAMARGEVITAIGMTEPGAGSDLAAIRTQARRDGGAWRIDGQKIFISNGQIADLVLLAAKTDPERGAHGVSLLLVTADRPGFARGRRLEKLGMHAQDTSELFFSDVRVPAGNLLGAEGQGFRIMMNELPQERLLVAITAVGAMEAAVEWTRQYVLERSAFGAPLSAKQAVRHRLAEAHANVQAARAFLDSCMARHLEGRLDTATASAAKFWCTEMQFGVIDNCLQLFGGYGYMREYPIARAWADARVQRIYGGTTEIMKEIVARALFQER
ncbi:acyl-CoA dehydrogenase [Ramlibacter sp. RBP-2]|uniref:Acyl-[acyl-carrier-protein] dehydrogenase MbtN n=1 Tax=Ramlibacter lithotrophicus TaxID=2606681 RepID=A0A7X6I6F3_9BURK|nr:acyl-CoA dehydrogenase family protein [Ramlibacter lithotrophicus]NKE66306.1 acyl-CoA dehydrogenase [Ramlibacter lithotrophicus]